MMNDVRVLYLDLPCSIRGFVRKHAFMYFIVLNSRLSREQNRKTLQHELDHIRSGHLEAEGDVQLMECEIKHDIKI